VDDHVLVRAAVAQLLRTATYQVVGEAADGHEAMRLAGAGLCTPAEITAEPTIWIFKHPARKRNRAMKCLSSVG
jgi:hypothetical protein